MNHEDTCLSFGPVPSRRLGRSVGINNIPAKVCSYACVYCQVGRTLSLEADRRPFYDPQALADDVSRRTGQAGAENAAIDYLTFVPDGEPTLDLNLGREIALLKPLGLPIGVISNSSLIGRPDVRRDLLQADWVSLKMDAVVEPLWRRVNRPHGSLKLGAMLEGALAFAAEFRGRLATETMLVLEEQAAGEPLERLAQFLSRLRPAVAYLGAPTRPTAEPGVQGVGAGAFTRAYHVIGARVPKVEFLTGYEGDAFTSTGDVEKDLLAITAVHPMRREAVEKMLAGAGADGSLLPAMVARGDLVSATYGGHEFFLRRFKKPAQRQDAQPGSKARTRGTVEE
ncbi:MAG TPA: radical SAM protein [Candidatus Aminicenantes bacterium]|nr:radical SAM protein [Candidatus Aminicenantes bacterium]